MTTRADCPPLSGGTIWVGKHRPREERRRDYIARRPVSPIKAPNKADAWEKERLNNSLSFSNSYNQPTFLPAL